MVGCQGFRPKFILDEQTSKINLGLLLLQGLYLIRPQFALLSGRPAGEIFWHICHFDQREKSFGTFVISTSGRNLFAHLSFRPAGEIFWHFCHFDQREKSFCTFVISTSGRNLYVEMTGQDFSSRRNDRARFLLTSK
jgi:hypothetical protein